MSVRRAEIEKEFSRGEQQGEAMQRFFDMAMMFKVLDQESHKSKSLLVEEEKKEELPAQTLKKQEADGQAKTDVFALVDEALAEKPWTKVL
jgi:hypothetical protein